MSQTRVETQQTFEQIFERCGIAPENRTPDNFFIDPGPDNLGYAIPREIEIDHAVYQLDERGTLISPTAEVHPSSEIGGRTIIQSRAFVGQAVKIGKRCLIAEGATLNKESELANCVTVKNKAFIGEVVVVGAHVEIGEGSRIDDYSLVKPYAKIGNKVVVRRGSTVGEKVDLGNQVYLEEYVKIGDESKVMDGVRLKARRKIRPRSLIYLHSRFERGRKGNKTTD